MASPPKRAQSRTHWSVWIGLVLAAGGLLVAMYAYTGTRAYDVTYAGVAVAGGVLALAGILVSAWGRAIMAARAQRARRAARTAALPAAPVGAGPGDGGEGEATLPTVAEPASKKRFAFPARKAAKEATAAGAGGLFAFKRRGEAVEPSAPEAPSIPRAQPEPAASLLTREDEDDEVERLTLKCPRCAAEFTAEGRRPLAVRCPACSFEATV